MRKKPIKTNEVYTNIPRFIEYFTYHILYFLVIGPFLLPTLLIL